MPSKPTPSDCSHETARMLRFQGFLDNTPVTSPVTSPVRFLVIVDGNLSLLIVPVVMLAASARLVAVVWVPVTSPVTSPTKLPVTLPVKFFVIVDGNLSLLTVPVVMLAPFTRLVT